MLKTFNPADRYIALWCFLDFLGVIRMFDILSVALLGLAFIIAFRHAITLLSVWNNLYLSTFNILMAMFTLYGFFSIAVGPVYDIGDGEVSRRVYLINIYKSLLPIYALYYYSLKGYLNEEKLRKWTYVFVVISIMAFMKRWSEGLDGLLDQGSTRGEITNNNGYYMLALLPCTLFFHDKKVIQNILLLIISAFVVIGLKRGAMIIGVICLFFMFLSQWKKVSIRSKYFLLFFGTIIALLIAYFAYQYYLESDYFKMRLELTMEGYTSGRDDIAQLGINYFMNEASIVEILFGGGADRTLGVMGNYAHNDWLEILINQGLMGIIVYLVYFIGLFLTWRKAKWHNTAYVAIGIYVIIFFFRTFFSMSYYDTIFYSNIPFAYYLVVSDRRLQKTIYRG